MILNNVNIIMILIYLHFILIEYYLFLFYLFKSYYLLLLTVDCLL
jgi:hypothetical protein